MNHRRVVPFSSEWDHALDEYVASHKEGSLFHTRAWSRVLNESFRHEDRTILALQGRDIVGFLPLFVIRHPVFGGKAISIPLDACYGGVFTSDETWVAERLTVEAVNLVRKHDLRFLEIRTMQRQEWLRDLGFVEGSPMTYSIVPLHGHAENWRRLDGSARRAVRKAVREGVVVRASNRAQDLAVFHELLARSFRAFGSPVWGFEYLRNMGDFFAPGVFRLLIAEHNGKVIGGVILLIFCGRAIYKYGACALDSYPLRPFNLLLWRAIELCIEEGCTELNTGSHNPRDAGLLHFKRTLGGIEGPDYFYYFSSHGRPPNYARYFGGYRVAKAVWRRLPLPITMFLGARITRWLC